MPSLKELNSGLRLFAFLNRRFQPATLNSIRGARLFVTAEDEKQLPKLRRLIHHAFYSSNSSPESKDNATIYATQPRNDSENLALATLFDRDRPSLFNSLLGPDIKFFVNPTPELSVAHFDRMLKYYTKFPPINPNPYILAFHFGIPLGLVTLNIPPYSSVDVFPTAPSSQIAEEGIGFTTRLAGSDTLTTVVYRDDYHTTTRKPLTSTALNTLLLKHPRAHELFNLKNLTADVGTPLLGGSDLVTAALKITPTPENLANLLYKMKEQSKPTGACR